jgi:hypothetical protein
MLLSQSWEGAQTGSFGGVGDKKLGLRVEPAHRFCQAGEGCHEQKTQSTRFPRGSSRGQRHPEPPSVSHRCSDRLRKRGKVIKEIGLDKD